MEHREESTVSIYGDSIMRGTVIDESMRYHSTISGILQGIAARWGIAFKNRSRFGISIQSGEKILQGDLDRGEVGEFALVEFGGNDCSFLWNEVSERPQDSHEPVTGIEKFRETCRNMVSALQRAGAKPVLMTLPPIDAERHLEFIGRGGNDAGRILRWLGDVQMIYRFHELYSNTVAQVAKATGALLVDVRARFLDKHNMRELVGRDGVHPSACGYRLIAAAFEDFIAARRGAALPAPV